ncbi:MULTISPECIES: hypothetical protein [Bacillales]|uniref:hypothetical protein n=1 Tax=Bacillales TaxID=1385 RepID=UPI00037DCAE4|nr:MULTISPECIES: hypothetical protein [Bacillales]KMZ44446.1 hypothetical protein AC624_27010 [Bacillus sp. FJAT-27238]
MATVTILSPTAAAAYAEERVEVPKLAKKSQQVQLTESAPAPASEQKTMSAEEVSRFKEYAPNLKGGPFITEADIVNQNEAVITYADFSTLKKAKPETGMTEADAMNYWESGDAINKTLMEEPIRLLKEFLELQKVKVTLNHGKKYTTEIDRVTIEDYLKVNLAETKTDKDKWRNEIVNKFFTKEERAKYIERFVKAE